MTSPSLSTFLRVLGVLAWTAAASAQVSFQGTIPVELQIQGRLEDPPGTPVTQPTTLQLDIMEAATGQSPRYTETDVVTPDADGTFVTTLGDGSGISPRLFDQPLWVEITPVGQSPLSPRLKMHAAPFAAHVPGGNTLSIPSSTATTLDYATDSYTISGVQDRVHWLDWSSAPGTNNDQPICKIQLQGDGTGTVIERTGMRVTFVLARDLAGGDSLRPQPYNGTLFGGCVGVSGANFVGGFPQIDQFGEAFTCEFFESLGPDGLWDCR